MKEKIILGIDPGMSIMGFAVIKVQNKTFNLSFIDELILSKCLDHEMKLKNIFKKTLSLIDLFHPDAVAIEAPFYGKNIQSMLTLAKSQSVSMAAALHREIPITEYSPKKIKMSVTGNGNASKKQVSDMLKTLLHIKEFSTRHLDASDSLAVAVCHYLNSDFITSQRKNYSGWTSFVRQNPKRIKSDI